MIYIIIVYLYTCASKLGEAASVAERALHQDWFGLPQELHNNSLHSRKAVDNEARNASKTSHFIPQVKAV